MRNFLSAVTLAVVASSPGLAAADDPEVPPSRQTALSLGYVAGSGTLSSGMTSTPHADRPVMVRKSVPMLITGLSLIGTGAVSAALGAVFYVDGTARCDRASAGDGSLQGLTVMLHECSRGAYEMVGGVASIVAGGVFAIVGTPLALVGAQTVPAKQTPVPAVAIGPRSAALRWQF